MYGIWALKYVIIIKTRHINISDLFTLVVRYIKYTFVYDTDKPKES